MVESGSVAVAFCCRWLYHISSNINPKYTYKSPPPQNIWMMHMGTRFTSYLFMEAHMSVSSSVSRHEPTGPEPWVPADKTLTVKTRYVRKPLYGFSLASCQIPSLFWKGYWAQLFSGQSAAFLLQPEGIPGVWKSHCSAWKDSGCSTRQSELSVQPDR